MAKQDWLNYFDLLTKLAGSLEELATLQEEKTVAVEKGNLPKIDEIMKKEQAFALTLRNYEQKRLQALVLLQVPKGPIQDLEKSMPMEVKIQGKKVVADLQEKYGHYQAASKVSREMLLFHLNQIEERTGIPSGYEPPSAAKKQERSLEKEGAIRPGNVPLNLRQLEHKKAPTPKVLPVSQAQLTQVQNQYQEAQVQSVPKPIQTVGAGNLTSDLRRLAQEQERERNSLLQKRTLQDNAKQD